VLIGSQERLQFTYSRDHVVIEPRSALIDRFSCPRERRLAGHRSRRHAHVVSRHHFNSRVQLLASRAYHTEALYAIIYWGPGVQRELESTRVEARGVSS
jgi:hypothetical protein